MTCRDCLHWEACKHMLEAMGHTVDGDGKSADERCNDFADKSRFVELPCKIGGKIYKLWGCGKHGKSVAEFEVMHFDVDNLPEIEISFRKTMGSGYYYFAKASDIGKTVFLTREAAEEAIKEKENAPD